MNIIRGNTRVRHSILLVEDVSAIRELLTAYLQQMHFKVLPCSSAEEALRQWPEVEEQTLVLITDITLGAMSGCHLAAELRRRRPMLPVIFVSGMGNPSRELLPNSVFLEKPFSLQVLTDTIQGLVAAAA
jgi:two-component system cell cycle sensor histidine kinase/response regulator CckA